MDWTLKWRKSQKKSKRDEKRVRLDVEAVGMQAKVQTERERVTDWMLKLRKTRKKSNEQKTQQKGRCQS